MLQQQEPAKAAHNQEPICAHTQIHRQDSHHRLLKVKQQLCTLVWLLLLLCIAWSLGLLQSLQGFTHPDLTTVGASNKHSSWVHSSTGCCCAAAGLAGLRTRLLLLPLQRVAQCSKQCNAAADGRRCSSYRRTSTVLLCGVCNTCLSNKCCSSS
jgi:hypothetical protein